MSATHLSNRSPATVACGAAFAIALLLSLIGIATYRHPTSVTEGGLSSMLITVGVLIVFGIVSVWSVRHGTVAMRTALISGASVGLVLGFIEMGNIALEYSSAVNQTVRGIAGPAAMGMMALLFGSAGSIAYQRTSTLKMAVWSGFWCALISTVVACIFGFVYDLVFMPHMEQIMFTEYVRSGMHDPGAFVVRHTLEAASSHLLIAPILAAIFSCLGGFVSARLDATRRLAATVLALLGTFQLGLSIALIHFALSLARSQRPPLIVTGMILGGISLTYVFPVLSVLFGWHKSQWTGRDGPLREGVA